MMNNLKQIKRFYKMKKIVFVIALAVFTFLLFNFYLPNKKHFSYSYFVYFPWKKPPPSLSIIPYENSIPRVIHYIYLGGKDWLIDKSYEYHISGCMEVNPNYIFVLWTEVNAQILLEKHFATIPQAAQATLNSILRSKISLADVLRYLILEIFGGIYMDMDTICQKPLDSYIDFNKSSFCYLGFEPPLQTQIIHNRPSSVMNNIILCTPHHPFMKQLLDNIDTSGDLQDFDVMHFSGPFYVDEQYKQFDSNDKYSIKLLDYHLFHPNPDFNVIQDACNNNSEQLIEDYRIRPCRRMKQYTRWLNKSGSKNAVLLHDWLHLGWKQENVHGFDVLKKFSQFKIWPPNFKNKGKLN